MIINFQKSINEKQHYLLYSDIETGITYNHRRYEKFATKYQEAERGIIIYIVCWIDIDNFMGTVSEFSRYTTNI